MGFRENWVRVNFSFSEGSYVEIKLVLSRCHKTLAELYHYTYSAIWLRKKIVRRMELTIWFQKRGQKNMRKAKNALGLSYWQ